MFYRPIRYPMHPLFVPTIFEITFVHVRSTKTSFASFGHSEYVVTDVLVEKQQKRKCLLSMYYYLVFLKRWRSFWTTLFPECTYVQISRRNHYYSPKDCASPCCGEENQRIDVKFRTMVCLRSILLSLFLIDYIQATQAPRGPQPINTNATHNI